MAQKKGKKRGDRTTMLKSFESHESAEKPVSLAPLKFDEAVSALLRVKPDRKDEKSAK